MAAALAKKSAEVDTVRGLGRSAGRATGGAPRADSINNALNAAFASAMAQPAPAALEEEWYVSIDGEQAGPFSLAEAQRWVAQQAFDAELHCWSEGFDDWLPVDKVSHFRGLRKRPQAAIAPAPPPLPRASASPRIAAPAPAEDEPKPLFAATMAALERGAPAIPTAGLGLPPTAAAPTRTTPPLGTPIGLAAGLASRAANGVPGAASSPMQTRPGFAPDPRAGARGDAGRDAKPGGTPGARPGPASAAAPGPFDPGPLGGPAARPQLLGDPFGPGDGEGGDLETQLEAMPFEDPADADARSARAAGAAGAGLAGRPGSSDAAMTSPHLPASSTLPGTGANAAVTAPSAESVSGSRAVDFGTDDDLDIGEVSRVVNLADVSRAPRPDRSNARRAGAAAPAEPARPMAGEPSLRSGIRPGGGGARPATAGKPAGDADPGRMMAPVVRAHRRGLIALLAVAALMVLGVIGAVLVFVARDDDVTGDSLGPVHDIDTSRPDDPITHHPVGSAAPVAPSPAPVAPTAPRPVPHPRSPSSGGTGAESPGGPALAGDEIEDVARKHQETTQRCYMRSQRGADAILIGDVKKIAVTLTIDREGNVSDLQLSEHAADNLGRCLTGAIRAWKFRQSSGGTFRFSLNFVSG